MITYYKLPIFFNKFDGVCKTLNDEKLGKGKKPGDSNDVIFKSKRPINIRIDTKEPRRCLYYHVYEIKYARL